MSARMSGREFICGVSGEKDALMIRLACEILDAREILPTELGRSLSMQFNAAE